MTKTKSKKVSKKSPGFNQTKRQSSKPPRGTAKSENSSTDLSARAQSDTGTPLTFMRRFSEEVDRLFEEFGFGRTRLAPTLESGLDKLTAMAASKWSPPVEVFEHDNQLVIRADLPGLAKDNVDIDIANDAVVISGERKSERAKTEAGYYRSERSYGSFYRRIPLPEGVSAEQATADFRNGVLEIKLPTEKKDRKIEIRAEFAVEEQPRSRAKAAGQR